MDQEDEVGSTNSNSERKRIRAFPANIDENMAKEKWAILKTAIEDILTLGNTGLIFEELYRISYTMVLHKHGDKLYNGMKEVVKEHFKTKILPIVLQNKHKNFLVHIFQTWTSFMQSMVWVRDILLYMDRVFVQQNNVENVYNVGVNTFKREIILHKEIRNHLRLLLLDVITREREGELVDRSIIKNICQMLIALGPDDRSVYESIFERSFLKHSEIFYRVEGFKLLELGSITEYVKLVENRLTEESERSKQLLDSSTEPKITEIVENELVKRHLRTIINVTEWHGVLYLLENDKFDELGALYQLLSRVIDGLEVLGERVSRYVRDEGKAIVQNKNPIYFVQRLLDLKLKLDNIILTSFRQDKIFLQMLLNDIHYCLNLETKSPEYLALFIDDRLKKEIKGVVGQDIDDVLNRTMALFSLILDKEMFEHYYTKHIERRLLCLLQKSFRIDNLETLQADLDGIQGGIMKLRKEFGYRKLEGMFKDLAITHEMNFEFQSARKKSALQVDLSVRVLTEVFWGSIVTNIPTGIIPDAPLSAFEEFKKHYSTKYGERKLILNPQLGSADLIATYKTLKKLDVDFPKEVDKVEANSSKDKLKRPFVTKSYTIQVSTYQMCILMLFNEHKKMTFDEILAATEIPKDELVHALQSLAVGKMSQRVLSKIPNTPKTKVIKSTDVFFINESFTSKVQRLKITSFSTLKREIEEDRAESLRLIVESRSSEIEAAIVRVMKFRNKLPHNLLIDEVENQLKSRFIPSKEVILSNLDNLISKDLIQLSEDEDKKKIYTYIA